MSEASEAYEEIVQWSAEKLAELQPVMVNELTDTPNAARTVWVAAARVDGVEGVVHVVSHRRKYWAKFTSNAEYAERWGA